ncbi:putative RNA helicase [Dioscorea sansibarensis]
MEIAIIPATLAVASPTNRAFSSLRHLSGSEQLRFPTLSFDSPLHEPRSLTIRMGGGPRTYPGGVSKWQWKRMQAKKAKQLLKARLCRERQLYEMRKRAELKAAVAELEKPWEVVERAPTLFSVKADEQVKALADRFQKPGGFDMWTEKDGPQVFRTPDGLPSARFFPKGVVHSLRPYGIGDGEGEMRFDDWIARGGGGGGYRRSSRRNSDRHGREGSEVLEVGNDEGIVHTRWLMNVQKDGGSEIRNVNHGYEDGGEVGIDGWNGSKRSTRRSPSRRQGRDGLETEYVVAEFEDSVEQGEEVLRNSVDGGGNVDSSFKSRNRRFSKMEEGNAMEGGRGLGMDEFGSSRYSRKSGGVKKSYDDQGGASSSRYSRASKFEKGNAMGGGRRYGRRAPYERERSSDRRSYVSDPETMGIERADGSRMDEQRNARGSSYGRGQRRNQRSYASDSGTMGRQQGRHVGGPPYGRTYASYSETMANGRGRDDGRNRRGIRSKRVSIRPTTDSLYDGDV